MRHPRSLWHELKRRKVWRTGAVYAAVAWGVLQLADVVWEPLGLPEWTMTLLVVLVILGFPVVLTLEWVFEQTSEGVRRTSRTTSPGKGGGLLPRSAAIGAALLIVGGGAWRLVAGDESAAEEVPPVTQSAVALFPCEVRGGARMAHMAEGMVHLLASRLQQGTDVLRPLDPRSVLSFLDRQTMDAVGAETAGRYARRLGAGHYVRCDVLELFDGDVQVKAALYRLGADDEPIVDVAAEGPTSEIPALADELAARMITGSVGSASRVAREAARTSDPVPLEAWKAYVEGERAFRLGRYAQALVRLEEAVQADSTFALAHYRLAVASNWAEQRLQESTALAGALRHSHRLSPQDRALVRAYAAYTRGAHGEAKRRYREITRAYPQNLEAWYVLGEVLFHYGWLSGEPISRADSAFNRAAELDPGNHYFEVLFHQIHLAGSDARPGRLDSLAARVEPEDSFARVYLLLLRGDAAAVDSAIQLIPTEPLNRFLVVEFAQTLSAGQRLAEFFVESGQPDWQQTLGHLELAGIEVARGRWAEALEAIDRAARLRPDLALEMKAYMALAAPQQLEGIDFASIAEELRAWNPPTDQDLPTTRSHEAPHAGLHPWLRLYLMGLLEARIGETDAALARAQALAGADAPPALEEWLRDLEAIVRSEVARSRGDAAGALDLLQRAPLWTVYRLDPRFSSILGHFYPVVMRAELLLELGRPHEALRWYGGFDNPFYMQTDPISTRAMIGTAQALEAVGDKDPARALQQQVLQRLRTP